MAPLNSTLLLASANNTILRASAANGTTDEVPTKHTGIAPQWVPLFILALIVVLIIIIIAMPKAWMVNTYNRISRATKHIPTIAKPPRRIFNLFSSPN